jgi:hypothetical protein
LTAYRPSGRSSRQIRPTAPRDTAVIAAPGPAVSPKHAQTYSTVSLSPLITR